MTEGGAMTETSSSTTAPQRGEKNSVPADPVIPLHSGSETSIMAARYFYVYILASKIGGTVYIGVTNDLVRRVGEHRLKVAAGFTEKYGIHRLVYFEQFDDPENAIRREKRLKK